MTDLTFANDTARVPELGDIVIVRFASMVKAAMVIGEPEHDRPGRHRLDLLVMTPTPFRPVENTPPATEPEGDGWYWRTKDLREELR